MVEVELVYISANKTVTHLNLMINFGATVADALNLSGLSLMNPEIDALPIGIFSKRVNLDTQLKNGDRIEIYRPLLADPKELRRKRAKI